MVAVYPTLVLLHLHLHAIPRRLLRSRPRLRPRLPLQVQLHDFHSSQVFKYYVAQATYGSRTPTPDSSEETQPRSTLCEKSPYYFETGYALQPKRPSRPFPPPFVSKPSTSFSDPLTTHYKSQDRRPKVKNELIRGLTNGDDAVLASEFLLGVNDGVGAWQTKPEGHAA